jgi:hypothetical protein
MVACIVHDVKIGCLVMMSMLRAEPSNVDIGELRRKLQQLQENTERMKRERGIRHHEL